MATILIVDDEPLIRDLIREHLSTLLPKLYGETTLKPELIRTVQMGPWQHKVDDGLDARKTAYETLYTLVRAGFRPDLYKADHERVYSWILASQSLI